MRRVPAICVLAAAALLAGCTTAPSAPAARLEPAAQDASVAQPDDPGRSHNATSIAPFIEIPKALTPYPDVLTGGQPTAEHLTRAAQDGYRTVINLRAPGEEGELAGEAELVRELGMRYVEIPIASDEDLSVENARRLAAALEAAETKPAMVHCRSGNRVGALFAIKAALLDGATAKQALATGRRSGLSPRLEPLVRERLGLPAPSPPQ